MRLFNKQWLTRYYVYEVMLFRPSWNEAAVDVCNRYFVLLTPTECCYNHPNLFDDLKDIVEKEKGTINVLVATKQLESFAFKYAKIHFKGNQSGIFPEKNYGMSIYSVAI